MSSKKNESTVLDRRRAGILLHPTSLPGPGENGDLGPNAYHFVDFLQSCGSSVWQMLPLVPTHDDNSPYMGLSVLAGNPALISLELLENWGWLRKDDTVSVTSSDRGEKHAVLTVLCKLFNERADDVEQLQRKQFLASHQDWLTDYALFQVLRETHDMQSWVEWPAQLRDRDAAALQVFQRKHKDKIETIKFEQFVFFRQFQLLKDYANGKGVSIFGDMPIFVAHDSAEVWAHRGQFLLNEDGQPRTVAGVPPDYFSETGQRWGNPHYNWKQMRANGFAWWVRRLQVSLELFDLIRVDHFRGFEAYWEIKASEPTAINGKWRKAPGKALFNALIKHFGFLPFVAEDLGVITAEVDELREMYGWPGMKILQFAFDGNRDNPYLPHNHSENSVVYTGTHDNDTTQNWYRELPEQQRDYLKHYLGCSVDDIPWLLIRCALASTARLAVLPMQDLISTQYAGRMNSPGKLDGNWSWRFDWDHIESFSAAKLLDLNRCFDRVVE